MTPLAVNNCGTLIHCPGRFGSQILALGVHSNIVTMNAADSSVRLTPIIDSIR